MIKSGSSGDKFAFPYMDVRLTHDNLLKELSFLHCSVRPPLSQSTCLCVWRGQVRDVYSVPLVTILIFVLYFVIFITWSQLLQLYNSLDISKIHYFFSLQDYSWPLNLCINFRISLSSSTLNNNNKRPIRF